MYYTKKGVPPITDDPIDDFRDSCSKEKKL